LILRGKGGAPRGIKAQFHPEGSEQTLGPIWQHKAPQLMQNYHPRDKGNLLVENFLRLVVEQLQQSQGG